MIHTVVMAGGKGTRFWPLSRENRPKQLLSVVGEKTMIQDTVERLLPIAPIERCLVITGEAHADEIRRQLPGLPEENIIAEPVGRNTAPCVALAAMIVKQRDPDGVMGVFPADHLITRPDEFHASVKSILGAIEKNPDSLATMGIKPEYPETGYGYIKRGGEIAPSVYRVDEFLEKPDYETAHKYADSGMHYWNSGMFFWKADTILSELERCLPDLMKMMAPIAEHKGTDELRETVNKLYPRLPSISIDYGVMEKAGARGKVIVAEADPGWNDVGSWRSLYDLVGSDEEGNRKRGEFVAVGATGVLAHNEKRLVAVVGVDDVIVIETDDAILVCHKDRAQDVRAVTEKLKERGLDRYL